MAVNLSDIAGKAGNARALVALALPAPADPAEVEALYEGMRRAAARMASRSSAATHRRRPAAGS